MYYKKKSRISKTVFIFSLILIAVGIILNFVPFAGSWKVPALTVGIIFAILSPVVYTLDFKINTTLFTETITSQKSQVRITKAKYVQTLSQVGGMNANAIQPKAEVMENTASLGLGAIGGAVFENEYKSTIQLVTKLSEEYTKAQETLNKMIEEYNGLMITFPSFIYARILRLTKMEYVGQTDIDKSIAITADIDKTI